jgi:hypothetical protein
MGGLPGAPGSCPYGVEEEQVGQMNGMCPGSAGDDGPYPVNC